MPEYVIVHYDDNWADEFDVECKWVVHKPVWEAFAAEVTKYITQEVEIYFGTNEYISIESGAAVVRACKVEEIPEQDACVIAKYFGQPGDDLDKGGLHIGQIDVFGCLSDRISEAKEEDKDDSGGTL